MSCPHVVVVAAILKDIHPDWFSEAIRSALTTIGVLLILHCLVSDTSPCVIPFCLLILFAYLAKLNNNMGTPITDSDKKIANPFQFGASHIQPSKTADPGLVYNASYDDYLLFLCRNNNNLLVPSFKCPNVIPSPSNLNYPSLVICKLKGSTTVTRTVTNVQ
ncbi:unnamed protein product [Fraxinus pennsylvanica]|uniref:Peptidase S8/S53 domain-containing protein n=1 Tax=Fraxinus pennsylvanica TaxID=56036 RepID=A0AAD1ZNT6_9LAMI|nr:unnamed protein product [Fraxinus pennsylvanica]